MNKVSNFIKRLIFFFLGMSIVQFGVALFLKTNIGSDPFTVFTQGIATILNKTGLKDLGIVQSIAGRAEVTPGVANMVILISLFTIVLIVDRKRIKLGTLICVIGVGPIIDFGVQVVSNFQIETYNYFVRMLFVLLGCFLIAVGFAILSESNIGVAPNDIVPFIIQDKVKVEYRWIRIAFDGVLLLVGFVLGGKIGIGTIIAMLCTGPFIQFCLPYANRLVNKIVKMQNEDDVVVV